MSSSDDVAPGRALLRPGVAEALRGRVVLAPLTRGGNQAFRKLCAELGAPITFSEMAHAVLLCKGERRELAMLRRSTEEKIFGVQIAAREPEPGRRAVGIEVMLGARLSPGNPMHQVTQDRVSKVSHPVELLNVDVPGNVARRMDAVELP